MSAAILGGSDGDSYYVESAEKSPTSASNTPDLAGHISELEAMHKVSDGEIDAITEPTVILSHTYKLKMLELANVKTDLPKILQDYGPYCSIFYWCIIKLI